ncbi:MAG: LacI family DNA-binding transcriptional regulator [Chloroflexota bacterium]
MAIKKTDGSRVKIDDVARKAGVSTATVSRVINKTGNVSAHTAEKVHQAIGDLKYVAHGTARGLASTTTKTIGLILPGTSSFFFSELTRGINAYINPQDYSLLMYAVIKPASMAGGNPLPLGEHNTDGLIVFSHFLDDYSIHYLHDQNLPIVMLHRSPPEGLSIPKVMFDNHEGAYQITRHMILQGRGRIVFLSGPKGNEDSQQREAGYRQALSEAGIHYNPALVSTGKFSISAGKVAIQRFLSQEVVFDAVFCGDDNSAVGVIEALRENGVQIPDEIAVAGFNDDVMSQYLSPPLTTVSAPIYQSGFIAAEKLLQLINGEKNIDDALLKTELIVRQSA